jgi:hypothetical protein
MKSLYSILLILLAFTSKAEISSNYDEVNVEMNNHIYILRSVWNYTETNVVDTIYIETFDDTIKLSYYNTIGNRDVDFNKFFDVFYNTDDIISVTMNDSTFSIFYNKLDYQNDLRIHTFIDRQLNYLSDKEVLSHNRIENGETIRMTNNVGSNKKTREGEVGLLYTGFGLGCGEVISRWYTDSEVNLKDGLRIFFSNKNVTSHWWGIMNSHYKVLNTKYIKVDNKIICLTYMCGEKF